MMTVGMQETAEIMVGYFGLKYEVTVSQVVNLTAFTLLCPRVYVLILELFKMRHPVTGMVQ